jgi:hypothetical protein
MIGQSSGINPTGDNATNIQWQWILDRTIRTHTRAHTEDLREQFAKLTKQLRAVEDELSRLAITLETALALGYAEDEATAADPVISTPAYRQILSAFAHADGPLRAGDLCRILDHGTEPKHREGMRSRLKRLAGHGILTEIEPGLFTLARPAPNP